MIENRVFVLSKAFASVIFQFTCAVILATRYLHPKITAFLVRQKPHPNRARTNH